MKSKYVPLAAAVSILVAGCSDTNTPEPCLTCNAAIAAVSPSFTSSDVTLTSITSPYDLSEGNAAQDLSDIRVAAYGENFYRIGRSSQNNITKYAFDAGDEVIWQYSTGENSNPYDVLFVSEEKAYVLRYGSGSIWVINPSVGADDEEGFKIGEIDLSAYDEDGVPNMAAGAIVDGKLFVAMQVLDATWTLGTAKLAVIDTETDTEIDVDGNAENGKAISLNVKNPLEIDLMGDSLYVTGLGPYSSAEYSGGIDKVSLADYSVSLLIDDGQDEDLDEVLELNKIQSTAIVSETQGFFVEYAAYQDTRLRAFDPSTGQIDSGVVAELEGVDIQSLVLSPIDELWVGLGDAESPSISILDPGSETEIESLALSNNPADIAFSN